MCKLKVGGVHVSNKCGSVHDMGVQKHNVHLQNHIVHKFTCIHI